VLAVRGDLAAARDLGERALRQLDVRANLAIVVRARYALGLAAEASGDHEAAYQRFRSLFDSDGAPVHHHVSYAALADLAAAAARTGRRADAAEVLDRAEHDLTSDRSDRLALLLHRGWALLASSEPADAEAHREAERHHTAALALPAAGRWPFERARLLLELGEWLRRRRRISEARPVLREALETFAGLGARPWVQRCEAELRAAGVAVSQAADALQALTPQQRQIVGLAAAGLTNREIAERMFLSARTVSSHLYRSFPKLGVSTRNQLRDVVPSSDH
jgi:ATP/maltotriose-dependent transcriptional regulator MalT